MWRTNRAVRVGMQMHCGILRLLLDVFADSLSLSQIWDRITVALAEKELAM